MKVLSVASEIFPLVKTGGLADVAGALPAALARQGVEMRSLVPGYPKIMTALDDVAEVAPFEGGRILSGRAAGLALHVVDRPDLYDRDGGPYTNLTGQDWPDNWRRFAALARAAETLTRTGDWRPDLVHAHDWQAGLVPVYLKSRETGIPSIITIHNIAFQGQFGAEIFGDLDLPASVFAMEGVEYYGDVGFLKGGLAMADAITTVSPTYAQEIRDPRFGMGLEGLIAARGAAVHGIVNGIDTGVWDPATDPHLAATYTVRTLSRRKRNTAALEARFGLEPGGPLFAVVSRLTWQKGLDLLAASVEHLVGLGGRLAVLGSGEGGLEAAFQEAAARHPWRVGCVIGYDEALSHLVQGGADAILVPSRFEPCGLTQLYALRYGCVPVVARTGGLADTVVDANGAALRAGVATGLVHAPDDADALRAALGRAVALYGTPGWAKLQRNGMKADVSWDASAAEYAALYRALAGGFS